MTTEPEFLSQATLANNADEVIHWVRLCGMNAQSRGATWHRWSKHQTIDGLYLHEAWLKKPVDSDGRLDEGDPRWQISAAA